MKEEGGHIMPGLLLWSRVIQHFMTEGGSIRFFFRWISFISCTIKDNLLSKTHIKNIYQGKQMHRILLIHCQSTYFRYKKKSDMFLSDLKIKQTSSGIPRLCSAIQLVHNKLSQMGWWHFLAILAFVATTCFVVTESLAQC